METDEITVFFMDSFALIVVYSICEHLAQKYYQGTLSVYDPYFFLLFVYLDYLGNRYRNNRGTFMRMILN